MSLVSRIVEFFHRPSGFSEVLFHLNQLQGMIIMNQQQLLGSITNLTAQVRKVVAESNATKQKLAALEQAIADSNTQLDPAVVAALQELSAQVQNADDVVTDVIVALPADPLDSPAATTTGTLADSSAGPRPAEDVDAGIDNTAGDIRSTGGDLSPSVDLESLTPPAKPSGTL
jgi:ABC-type transporter Mla subunit MlaD